jgi:nucleotide-binding universal stress UspA family protein
MWRRAWRAGVTVSTRLAEGPVAPTIIQAAGEGDLIALATHGRSDGGRRVYGSVADRVLRASPIPILLVRAGVVGPEGAMPDASPARGGDVPMPEA